MVPTFKNCIQSSPAAMAEAIAFLIHSMDTPPLNAEVVAIQPNSCNNYYNRSNTASQVVPPIPHAQLSLHTNPT